MTFDEQFPDAEVWFQPNDPYNEVAKGPTARPCWRCGTETQFIELNFEAHVCSEACNDKGWQEYFDALKERIEDANLRIQILRDLPG